MSNAPAIPSAPAADVLARALVADALASAFRAGNPDDGWSAEVLRAAWAAAAAPHSGVRKADLSLGELPPAPAAVGPLIDWLSLPEDTRQAARHAVFGFVVSKECPPFETEYIPSFDAATRAQHLADLGGFFVAFGLEPDRSIRIRRDHVSLHLGFVAFLLRKLAMLALGGTDEERDVHGALCRDALQSFLPDHLCWWLPTFARRLQLRAEGLITAGEPASGLSQLAGVALLLRSWIAVERISAGCEPARRLVEPNVSDDTYEDDACLSAQGEGSCTECSSGTPPMSP